MGTAFRSSPSEKPDTQARFCLLRKLDWGTGITGPTHFYVLFAVIFVSGVLNAVVFGMDKETLNRLNWVQMKVQRT